MTKSLNKDVQVRILLPSKDLHAEMAFFTGFGFRLDQIYPADDPEVARMSGHGLHIELDRNAETAPVTLVLESTSGEDLGEYTAPNGSIVKVIASPVPEARPETLHRFQVRKLEGKEPWVIGRAGMLYRDLIPGRLGGSIIASHIRIPEGGPVPDMVHYHTIGFQLIFCIRGWVRLVYEDQGPPFILRAGDCVTQPPEIRHRVLEASDNLEVVEIGVPAAHMTTIDHEMDLPTKEYRPDREFQGQRFCHHKQKEATWKPWRIEGFECRDTGISEASGGVASVRVARRLPGTAVPREPALRHGHEIYFCFLMNGEMRIIAEGHPAASLSKGEAYVIPPGLGYRLENCSDELELLEVMLPA